MIDAPRTAQATASAATSSGPYGTAGFTALDCISLTAMRTIVRPSSNRPISQPSRVWRADSGRTLPPPPPPPPPPVPDAGGKKKNDQDDEEDGEKHGGVL